MADHAPAPDTSDNVRYLRAPRAGTLVVETRIRRGDHWVPVRVVVELHEHRDPEVRIQGVQLPQHSHHHPANSYDEPLDQIPAEVADLIVRAMEQLRSRRSRSA